MKRVNNIFYSIQGEGYNTGRAALFVRFAGCNLQCPFCDTDFNSYYEWSDEFIVDELLAYCIDFDVQQGQSPMVVLTGGEPTLQVDKDFVNLLHKKGFYVAMESNGLLPAPQNIDWLTVSPKIAKPGTAAKAMAVGGSGRSYRMPDEIKIVFDGNNDPEDILADYAQRVGGFDALGNPRLYVQPCDAGDEILNTVNTGRCVQYVMMHPRWQLSLQTHKLIGIQ